MGKESKETLKAILANTQLILKHLKIEPVVSKLASKEIKSTAKKGASKKTPARTSKTSKK